MLNSTKISSPSSASAPKMGSTKRRSSVLATTSPSPCCGTSRSTRGRSSASRASRPGCWSPRKATSSRAGRAGSRRTKWSASPRPERAATSRVRRPPRDRRCWELSPGGPGLVSGPCSVLVSVGATGGHAPTTTLTASPRPAIEMATHRGRARITHPTPHPTPTPYARKRHVGDVRAGFQHCAYGLSRNRLRGLPSGEHLLH